MQHLCNRPVAWLACDAASKGAAMTAVEKPDKRNLDASDERRRFDRARVDAVTVGGVTSAHGVLQPNWRWSQSVKPIQEWQQA